MTRFSRFLALLLALALLAAACSSSEEAGTDSADSSDRDTSAPDSDTTDPDAGDVATLPMPDFELAASLRQLDSCDELLDHLQTTAASAVGPYGFGDNGGWWGPVLRDDAMMEGDFDAVGAEQARSAAPQPTFTGPSEDGADTGGTYSGTNVQEAGVDEPDVVKTDGEHIVTVVDGTLRVFDVDSKTQIGNVALTGGWNHQLFLTGDTAWVISGGGEMIIDVMPVDEAEYYPGGDGTRITEVDLSDPTEPTVVDELEVEGSFLNARLVGDTAHIVVRSQPLGFSFVQPTGPDSEEAAQETNQRILADSTLEQWLPRAAIKHGDADPTEIDLVECNRVFAPDEFSGFGMLNVIDLDVNDGLSPTTTSVLGDGSTVYASTDALYIAGARWVSPVLFAEEEGDANQDRLAELAELYSTDLHKFDISDGDTGYVASGQVLGTPVNQFAMSEADGVLRIATTAGAPWSEGRDQSESFMTTFRVEGDELVEVGQVGDMGRGETIRSVRYVGDTAYVVTFQQTDPFYTVDLSDPANPEVMGELKILGYSGYLHPVGDDLILGIGQDATEEGRTTGAKVTLFDVSDPADPRAVANWTDEGASADVEWDHRAFLYWEPEGLAVLPLSDWQSAFFGAVGFDIGDGSISERGRITNAQDGDPDDGSCTRITDELLTETGNEELVGLIQGTYTRLCGPNDQPGPVPGYSCDEIPIEEIGGWIGQDIELDEDLAPPGSVVHVCYPNDGADQIVRSMVIDDEVWTLSQGGLRTSDLTTLDPTGWIAMAG